MNQELQIFSATVIAIFLEALPFLLLGSLLSALFEVYLPADLVSRLVPKRRLTGLLFGLCAGMVIPTCECGVVSIVRQLLRKGVPSHVAMTYMLAAPVINPLVLTSTYLAFHGDLTMTCARVVLVALCAIAVGVGLSGIDPELLLREGKMYKGLLGNAEPDGQDAHPLSPVPLPMAPSCGCGCEHHQGSRLIRVLLHAATELLDMGRYLILGAFAVGIFNVLPPYDLLFLLQQNVMLAVAGMMLLAVLLSVCSEADAFVAASFSTFPKVAQLSFVVLGPMVDLKLMIMYGAVFHRRVAFLLVLVPTVLTYLFSALLAGVMN